MKQREYYLNFQSRKKRGRRRGGRGYKSGKRKRIKSRVERRIKIVNQFDNINKKITEQ